jgi:hypothetical protein
MDREWSFWCVYSWNHGNRYLLIVPCIFVGCCHDDRGGRWKDGPTRELPISFFYFFYFWKLIAAARKGSGWTVLEWRCGVCGGNKASKHRRTHPKTLVACLIGLASHGDISICFSPNHSSSTLSQHFIYLCRIQQKRATYVLFEFCFPPFSVWFVSRQEKLSSRPTISHRKSSCSISVCRSPNSL